MSKIKLRESDGRAVFDYCGKHVAKFVGQEFYYDTEEKAVYASSLLGEPVSAKVSEELSKEITDRYGLQD